MARSPTEEAALRRSLARAITAIRVRRGMSRSELAAAAGIPVDDLSQIEDGKRFPHPGRFSHLASALGVAVADLIAAAEASVPGGESRPQARQEPRPRERRRSFVMPLMGGEWEATSGAEPTERRAEARMDEARPTAVDNTEDRTVILGELMLTVATLPTEQLRRLLELARELDPG